MPQLQGHFSDIEYIRMKKHQLGNGQLKQSLIELQNQIESTQNEICLNQLQTLQSYSDTAAQEILDRVQTGASFTDEDFLVEKAMDDYVYTFDWVRLNDYQRYPYEYLPELHLFGSDGEAAESDIYQGGLGNCYFLSALASLADTGKIDDLFITKEKNEAGLYAAKFFYGGRPIIVQVDDYIPVNTYSYYQYWDGVTAVWHFPIFTQMTTEGDFWTIILEKMYAKMIGSYMKTTGGMPENVLHFLSGSPVIDLHSEDMTSQQLDDIIEVGMAGNFPMTAAALAQNPCGIAGNHAFSVIGGWKNVLGSDGDSYNLIKLRNPWGSEMYSGPWSDFDALWTPEARDLMSQVDDHYNGYFMMPTERAVQYESYVKKIMFEISDTTQAQFAFEPIDQRIVYYQDTSVCPYYTIYSLRTQIYELNADLTYNPQDKLIDKTDFWLGYHNAFNYVMLPHRETPTKFMAEINILWYSTLYTNINAMVYANEKVTYKTGTTKSFKDAENNLKYTFVEDLIQLENSQYYNILNDDNIDS